MPQRLPIPPTATIATYLTDFMIEASEGPIPPFRWVRNTPATAARIAERTKVRSFTAAVSTPIALAASSAPWIARSARPVPDWTRFSRSSMPSASSPKAT